MLRLSRILRHAYEASYAKETLPAIIFLLSSPPSSLLLPVPIFLDRVVPSARVAGRLRCNDIYTPFYTSSLSLIEELLSSLFSCLKRSTSFFELPSLILRYLLNPARETFKSRNQDAEQTHDGLLRDRLPLRLLRWTPDRLLVDSRECDARLSHHFQCCPTAAPQAVSSNRYANSIMSRFTTQSNMVRPTKCLVVRIILINLSI